MSKRFLTDVVVESTGMPASRARALAADIIGAIRDEIISTGRFTLPGFGAFAVRETKARTALNPRTGEQVKVKAGATVRFKASPNLKQDALAGLKKAKRKAVRG
ncbi:HU family DNA-binding protein [Paracraurococcus lichenis]|uniref:HU family DNA-binding protein n=1 Tax=Paracraurococcus lichenis TaxID=3064888 RepID=A0ABT9ECM3_9PROT|nr:HU family DNA-binding protein [Paracraurococcus sp. LOR1-02]MDO9713972.1 HU family DNA-binding protein [Paracraurococcus sp. LOR1-02]